MATVASGAGVGFTPEADENHIGKLSMQSAANNNFIFTNLSSLKRSTETSSRLVYAALYQQVGLGLTREAHSNRIFSEVGDRLIVLAEQAYGLRQLNQLQQLSDALLTLPLPDHYQSAARYFRGLQLVRQGQLDTARTVFEAVAGDPPHRFTTRAIQSLGVTFHARGDMESALKLYIEAGSRAARNGIGDPVAALFTAKNVAVVKSANGDHRGALAGLERALPLARTVSSKHPQMYYDYLNSLAVELSSLGRLDEAARVARTAVSSPFAEAYPEWLETAAEIESRRQRSSRSAVAVRGLVASSPLGGDTRNPQKIFQLPARITEDGLRNQSPGAQARVLDFQQWKIATDGLSRSSTPEIAPAKGRMTTGEKLIRLMDLISREDTDDETIDRILTAVEQIIPNRLNKKLD